MRVFANAQFAIFPLISESHRQPLRQMRVTPFGKPAVVTVAIVLASCLVIWVSKTIYGPDAALLSQLFAAEEIDERSLLEYDDMSFGDARLVFGVVLLEAASLDVLAESLNGQVMPIADAKDRFPDVFKSAKAPEYWSPDQASELCVVVRPVVSDSTASYLFIVDCAASHTSSFSFHFVEIW